MELTEQELYCSIQHMIAFYRQSVFKETANFAEPCKNAATQKSVLKTTTLYGLMFLKNYLSKRT
ncbi:MAG: hypothetical protein LKJ25_00860 [Clostridia bacterium]|jgi:hypothetical protein|nr:hypothetical protein [Clostridia bacterium]